MNHARILIAMLSVCTVVACDRSEPPTTVASQHSADTPSLPTNRIAIGQAVRDNLGITFATVEPRHIEQVIRAPGRFELLPDASREYRMMANGRLELLVKQFDVVKPGTPLFEIDSPEWRTLQQQIATTTATIDELELRTLTYPTRFEAHDREETALQERIDVWKTRIDVLLQLQQAAGGRASVIAKAQSEVAKAKQDLAGMQEKHTVMQADRSRTAAELKAAYTHEHLLMQTAASLTGLSTDELKSIDDTDSPRWKAVSRLTARATAAGRVDTIAMTNGTRAKAHAEVLTVVQPERLRVHASGLQSDLAALRDGQTARIVQSTSGGTGLIDAMTGTLQLGLRGDADTRTIDLYVTPDALASWARPGVTAQLEIVTDSNASQELAIPISAIQQDGLNAVLFRRNPSNPDEVIRIDADLGPNDGRWVAILSGLRQGDEVVLDGGYQLMLASSPAATKGGHFHSDGTFHEESH